MKLILINLIGHVIEIAQDRGQGHRHSVLTGEDQTKADNQVTGIVIDLDRGVALEKGRGLGNDLDVIATIENLERNDPRDHDLEAKSYCPHENCLKLMDNSLLCLIKISECCSRSQSKFS